MAEYTVRRRPSIYRQSSCVHGGGNAIYWRRGRGGARPAARLAVSESVRAEGLRRQKLVSCHATDEVSHDALHVSGVLLDWIRYAGDEIEMGDTFDM